MIKIKNSLLLLCMLLAYAGYGQIISINNPADPESNFNLQDLVVDVLINSDCAAIDNFSEQVSGAATDYQTKSYGYFKKPSGSDFPFEDGVIITTGQAYPAGNVVNTSTSYPDFSNGLPGDADLEQALGITGTRDATYVKFNFTATSSDFNFRFLMASEEYNQDFECNYSDSFAFLLREVGTTNYINLAVLPDGTPVSVTNINNAPSCAANSEYFAGYNLESTNYGGRTEVLTANAVVTPNQAYEMKIVVADQGDRFYDSAIFLEAGSFSLGANLGDDLTLATGNAACDTSLHTLDSQIPISEGAHTWYKDGVLIPGENNQTLDVTEDGVYSVVIQFASNCTASDEVTIEFTTSPVANPVEDQSFCDQNNDGFYTHDFQLLNATVLGNQNAADVRISYHLSQMDADNNLNPITTPYTNAVANQSETIYVRIESSNFNYCYDTTSFEIIVTDSFLIPSLTPLEVCELDTDGLDTFDLTLAEAEILNALPAGNYNFAYYENQTDATQGNSSQIETPSDYDNIVSGNQTIYVKVIADSGACIQAVPVELVVHSLIEIGLEEQYLICLAADDSVIPAVSDTAIETAPLDTQLSEVDHVFQWYLGEEVLAANSIPGATGAAYNPTTIGFYTVKVTNILTGCTNSKTTEVVSSYPPESISAQVLTNAFSENSTIEVTVTGIGDYEFSLYEGFWQDSPIFENVLGGNNTVKVRDLYSCEVLAYEVTIIDYPKFFTPNNDGFNDTWNIQGVQNQLEAKIYIYDRYGKLIKQLSPSSEGWDGTFNGKKMPTSDYWFSVRYVDPIDGIEKEFISNFTLKR